MPTKTLPLAPTAVVGKNSSLTNCRFAILAEENAAGAVFASPRSQAAFT